LAYRIQRSATPGTVVFALSGEMDAEHATELRECLANEPDGHVVLDLKDVTLVDRAAVRFLAGVEGREIRIVNCPEYVRSWIAAEKALREPDEKESRS
jgi:anti-anti-sigma factor